MSKRCPVSLAAERAAAQLHEAIPKIVGGKVGAELLRQLAVLDEARVQLQAYEVTEGEIREQLKGSEHQQAGQDAGPVFFVRVFESYRQWLGKYWAEWQRLTDELANAEERLARAESQSPGLTRTGHTGRARNDGESDSTLKSSTEAGGQ